jgi:acyl dehydratase
VPAIGPGLAGRDIATITYTWDDRDVILYALGIGARLPGDLPFVSEHAPGGLRVTPTFALAPMTLLLAPLVAALGIDLRALLHAGQTLEVHRVPAAAGAATVSRRIAGVQDKGRAALVVCEDVLADGDGPLATARSSWWIAGAGGFGAPAPDGLPAAPVPGIPAGRPADWRATVATTAEQAALHRLSGDRNPVHIDPDMARGAGQPRPFLHGLCTFGALGHALGRAAEPGRRLASLDGRFTRPVFPGDTLALEAWWASAGAEAVARVAVDGELVLGPVAATFAPQ